MAIDPICGMTVDESSQVRAERDGQTFYFCCEHCRKKFLAAPASSVTISAEHHHNAGSTPSQQQPTGKVTYTCPMDPEVQQDHPGSCPKCGMALEPMTATPGVHNEDNAELRDMTLRFGIGAVLTLPVFVLAMAHMIPKLGSQSWVTGDVSRWIQFVLTIPVVCWAGWPFLQRGWRSIISRHLNMFTLIAIGVWSAFLFSAVAMLIPAWFPPGMMHHGKVGIYFEAAAMVTVFVLLIKPAR